MVSTSPRKNLSSRFRRRRRHRRLQDVLKKSQHLTTKPDVVVTMFGRRRQIYNIWKTSNLQRLEHIWLKTSLRCLTYDVLKTSVKQRLSSSVVVMSVQRQMKRFFLNLHCLNYLQNNINIKGNAQFVQTLTFEPLRISNKTTMELENITKATTFKSFLHLSYKSTQRLLILSWNKY